jgi:type I restriction-modification system DNA methylase subunit
MAVQTLAPQHLSLQSPEDVHEVFRQLGYDAYNPEPFEGDDLDQLELEPADREMVQRAYIVARLDNHTVYLFEVADMRQARLRSLAWYALQRGTALIAVTRDYREVIFADPRSVGRPTKSNVRVNKLKIITSDPTRHDADTLNAIHAHHRTGQQVYDAQADAFNVTKVTKKFYDEYRAHYDQTRAAVRQYNKGIREFQNEEHADKLHAFTQRLMGRLMFLYFLQRKGWLGGKQKFLTERYTATMRQHAGEVTGDQETTYYYRDVLEPLFFATLNTKRPDDITQWEGIRIPYLNGGLFDETRDPSGPIILPDSLFDPNSRDGLLAFFNRYNFTVTDDTPLEQDVAVDPEMLGKVFENMLEERDRGQSGSFYTPRAIVSYMCQEALAGYLEESAGIPRDTVRAQFDPDTEIILTPDEATRMNAALDTVTVLDPAVGSGSFLIGMMHEIIRLRRVGYAVLHGSKDVAASVLADWKEAIIRDTLYGVDIKPEAIEIAQLRLWLALVVDQTLAQARPLPNLDYKLMAGNSLIETIDGEPVLGEFAASVLQPKESVEWEHVNQQLRLLDPNPMQGRMLLFDEEKQVEKERVELDKLRQEFFRAAPERRRELRKEITTQERRIVYASLKEKADKLQAQIDYFGKLSAQTGGKLKAAEERKLNTAVAKLGRITQMQQDMAKPDYVPPFFLYRLHFSEVFDHKGGFDVVVANPPYVDARQITDQKPELKLAYPEVFVGTADLYVFFYARAYELLKANGQLSFITSNKYMRSGYGRQLRQFLSEKLTLKAVIDFGDLPVFDAAAYPCVVIAYKSISPKNQVYGLSVDNIQAIDDLASYLFDNASRFPQAELSGQMWQLVDNSSRDLLRLLWDNSQPLKSVVAGAIFSGIKTAANDVYEIGVETRDELIELDPESQKFIRMWQRGKNVKRWLDSTSTSFLIALQNSNDSDSNHAWKNATDEKTAKTLFRQSLPSVFDYISRFESKLRSRSDQGKWWWELRSCAYYDVFNRPKIIWAKYSIAPAFTYDAEGTLVANTVFLIPTDDLFLLGVLNSRVIQWYAVQNFNIVRGGYVEWIPANVEKLPIPNAPDGLRDQIAAMARRCLDTAQSAPDTLPALEAELNALVYQAYGLDAGDIAVIERQLAGSSNASETVEEMQDEA